MLVYSIAAEVERDAGDHELRSGSQETEVWLIARQLKDCSMLCLCTVRTDINHP